MTQYTELRPPNLKWILNKQKLLKWLDLENTESMQHKQLINQRPWTMETKWTYEYTCEYWGLTQLWNQCRLYWLFEMQVTFDQDEFKCLITAYLCVMMLCKWFKHKPNLYIWLMNQMQTLNMIRSGPMQIKRYFD